MSNFFLFALQDACIIYFEKVNLKKILIQKTLMKSDLLKKN